MNIIGSPMEPLPLNFLKIIQNQMENCVCKISFNSKFSKDFATGFLCKIPNEQNFLFFLITCKHVLPSSYNEGNFEINLSFNNDSYNKIIKLNDSRLIFLSEISDIAFIEIKKDDVFDKDQFCEIDDLEDISEKNNNKSIYLLGYHEANEAFLSRGKLIINKYSNDSYFSKHYGFQHNCSTKCGSGGSPIFNERNFKIIGIHKGLFLRNNLKIGNYLYKAKEELIKFINSENQYISNFESEKNESLDKSGDSYKKKFDISIHSISNIDFSNISPPISPRYNNIYDSSSSSIGTNNNINFINGLKNIDNSHKFGNGIIQIKLEPNNNGKTLEMKESDNKDNQIISFGNYRINMKKISKKKLRKFRCLLLILMLYI